VTGGAAREQSESCLQRDSPARLRIVGRARGAAARPSPPPAVAAGRGIRIGARAEHCVSSSRARNMLPTVRAELPHGAASPNRTLAPAAPSAAHMVLPHGAVGVGAELEQHITCLSRSLMTPLRWIHGVAARCRLPPAPLNSLVLRRRSRASRSAGYRAGCFPRH
jgi:hypothetical protein